MLDAPLRPWIDPPLNRIARLLVCTGMTADHVTLAGFGIGVGSWVALALEAYPVALGLILLNRIADGLDGALARRLGPSDRGGFLDIALDCLFYSGVPFFFALGRPEHSFPALFLVFSFVGTGTSFLAYAVIAGKRGLTSESRGKKSFFYSGGLARGLKPSRPSSRSASGPSTFPGLRTALAGSAGLRHFSGFSQAGWPSNLGKTRNPMAR